MLEVIVMKNKVEGWKVAGYYKTVEQAKAKVANLKKENNDLRQKIKVKNLRILQLSCLKAKPICEEKG